ncbi:MAG: hypothetical protein M3416_03305 [Acidobacteriota bacterium]|nr:hypothetical protein [Acidobacteriota bacterium]
MAPENAESRDAQRIFLETAPLKETKRLASVHGCDIGIPNDAGIGNILMYTRVVDDLAKLQGRPLKILTGRLTPRIGVVDDEDPFPLWRNDPFVDDIIDADSIDPEIMVIINGERDNLCQFTHMIENIAYHYGLRPRFLRPSLHLSGQEQSWALDKLRGLRRPVICLHPHGTSSPRPGHPWYEVNWRKLIDRLGQFATVLEILKVGTEAKQLDTLKIPTNLRQMMSLVWASDLFIGFDSSVAHIATAFELPSLVLWEPLLKVEIEESIQAGFAPAALSRWSYPQNRNLMLLGDRDDTIVNIITDWANNVVESLRT